MSGTLKLLLALPVCALLTACGGDTTTSISSGSDASSDSSDSSSSSSSSGSFDVADYKDLTTSACAGDTQMDILVCAVDAFLGTLSSSELSSVQYSWSQTSKRTTWSNLPTNSVQRNGLSLGSLSSESQAAFMLVARAALSDQGYEDMLGVMAADEYLVEQGGQSSGYGWEKYYIAVFGTPGSSEDWMLQLGGHHMAHNITYLSGTGYPVPNHLAAEPKASFVLNAETWGPLVDEGTSMVAIFDSLSSSELSNAHLSGTFGDVVMGPDNGSTTLDDYPDQDGQLVSSLTSAQQALVTAAIAEWVEDYPADVADQLMTDYTSAAAFAETYVAWGGTEANGVNVDKSGTYMRIDGPRVWIEVACQSGVILSGTHYHTIYRDKTWDYGNSL
ncbi:DUF3500 domain-containing protein [Thalassolituus sp. LLYu03]|uniref:DUF3500 domain-containing protein n=1 Tax=Thalassolituus sp. LLYu03 TaxID=3421656 RepID=UPI003D294C30